MSNLPSLPSGDFNMPPGVRASDIPGNEPRRDRRNKRGSTYQDRLNLLLESAQQAADWLLESHPYTEQHELGTNLQNQINRVKS